MTCKKINSIMGFILVIVLVALTCSPASGAVEWNVLKTLQLEAIPIDVAVSADGKRFFVLTDQGQVAIYSSTATLETKIDVGQHVDQIKLGPRGASLVLSSGKNKTVQIVTLDFIQKINVSGAPFKGAEDAAVVIAVFDDFQ